MNWISGIVRELGNENIDVINYTTNLQLYITRALSPARVTSIKINEEAKRAQVILKPEEVSKAIIENIRPENHHLLKADLEKRLGIEILSFEIGSVNFLRDIAKITVYYKL